MLSDIVEGWNEHLNDGLECLADIPRDVGCFSIPLRVGMNCLADIPRDVGCFLMRVGMNISMMD